jgi:hypothetical protein
MDLLFQWLRSSVRSVSSLLSHLIAAGRTVNRWVTALLAGRSKRRARGDTTSSRLVNSPARD